MYVSSLGIKVSRRYGERFRLALIELGALKCHLKIKSDESFIYLPTLPFENGGMERLGEIGPFEPIVYEFEPKPERLTPELILGYKPSFEVIGDVAIVEEEDAKAVAEALLSSCRNIRSIVTPISDVEGEFRTRRFRHVAGEEQTITLHKEHGLCYRVDLQGAYFTPRLGTERLRIAGQVRPGEFVLDMFAGVGPFALLLARCGAKVVAIDKNPIAVECLKENAALNKVEVEILQGDAAALALNFKDMADRIIMNLPHSAQDFLVPAIQAARDGGIIHYYAISPEDDLYRDMDLIGAAAADIGASVDMQYKGIVRSYAPHRFNVVIDFKVRKA